MFGGIDETYALGLFVGSGSCTKDPSPGGLCYCSEGNFFALGDAVGETHFVSAHEAVRAGVELDWIDLVATDGAREIARAYWRHELVGSVPVEAIHVSANEVAFLPVANGIALSRPEYLDASCTREALPEGAPGTIVTVHYASDPCRPRSCLRGPTISVQAVYVRQRGECIAVDGVRNVEECADLSRATPRFSIELLPGTSRLRRFDYVSAAGDRVPSDELFDTEANLRCTPTLVDGADRAVCVPDGADIWEPYRINPTYEARLYSDATCTSEALVAYSCRESAVLAEVSAIACRERVSTVRKMTSPLSSPLYIKTLHGCVQHEPEPGVVLYDRFGSSESPSLPELTLVKP